MSKLYWTKERCLELAKYCKSRGELKKKNDSAYQSALRNKWIDEYTWFTKPIEYSSKIDSVYAYIFPDNVAYIGRTINIKIRHWEHLYRAEKDVVAKYIIENNLTLPEPIILEKDLTLKEGLEREKYWVDYYLNNNYKLLNTKACGIGSGSLGSLGRGKWSKNKTFEEAKKYASKKEFRENCDSGYQAAYKHGWLKDYTWFKKPEPHNKIWTEEKCMEVAKKCKTIKEFREKYVSAHDASKKNGWFDKYTWLERAIKPNRYWNYDTCMEAAKKCKTKVEFFKKFSQGYQVSLANNWINEYKWLEQKHKPSNFWTKEKCLQEAKKYETKSAFRKQSESAYNKCCSKKWLDEISTIVWGQNP